MKQEIENNLPSAIDFLCNLIRYKSLSGAEIECAAFIYEQMAPLVDEIEKIPLKQSLTKDPDYSTPVPDLQYEGRFNLRLVKKGTGEREPVLFNTHIDVVPAASDAAFEPRVVEQHSVFGRGACDAKGQIATLYLLLNLLKAERIQPKGDIIIHLVVEEENGGNGTLAAVRRGEQAGAAIVLEPSALKILPSVRGAVWFRVICRGRSGHSGSAGQTISALKQAIEAIDILERYHARLLNESRGIALFDAFENPMPITFGKFHAGNWPATAPETAIFEGVLGLLPNKTRFQVMQEMEDAIRTNGNEWLKQNFQLEFMYKHDAHVLPLDHPLVGAMTAACKKTGFEPAISAMVASCDSWMINNQLKIPTVVFGPGDLRHAHTIDERIDTRQMATAAEVLLHFLLT
ncbi:M20/M25/M40 family metallo-hydrolase [candidate division KSB1 bacterium]|nr:M20/M25/M40 family metallo-hydrolase [candidate division KSB1 bacterium]